MKIHITVWNETLANLSLMARNSGVPSWSFESFVFTVDIVDIELPKPSDAEALGWELLSCFHFRGFDV